jgi:short subunit dehydrogenase-like uncharacterized protein
MANWMIYGANGYTGELIAREAVRRGHKPVLAGRSSRRIEALARELGVEARVFPIEKPQLDGISLVLHCAGPFMFTSAPMVTACLQQRAHYLDITGEIVVFEAIMSRNEDARRAGVTLLPGVGFDVVPTDCLAAMLKERLPSATELDLAFYPKGSSISRGTLKTMVEGIGKGGAIRRDGRITRVPSMYDVRTIPFSIGPRSAATIPWGDVSTAFHTTGIPNIRVYVAMPPKAIQRMRMMSALDPILALRPIKAILKKIADRRTGPGEEARQQGRTYLWGRVSDNSRQVTMTMNTPESYQFTVLSALAAVERVLAAPQSGAFTPARLLGADFVKTIPGVVVDRES